MPNKPRPLSGIQVVDCTRVLSGPICSRMLSDMGADVVKIEAPEADILRSTPPIVGGFGSMFAQYNVGKRDLSIDLKREGGPDLLAELIAAADVLVENFRPGVLSRLGLDPERLRREHPGLVVCSISGWGQAGPWATRPAYAPMVQAEAGTLALGGRLRQGRMMGETMQHADLYAGMVACQAILAALFHRERTGRGDHIDVAMGEVLLYVNEHASAEIAGHDGSLGFATWTFESFRLGDGRAVHVMGRPDQLFPLLASQLPIPGALEDPRFATPEARAANHDALVATLDDALAAVPDHPSLVKLLEGTPLVAVPVRSTRELAESEWAHDRGALSEPEPGLFVPTAPWRSREHEIGAAGDRVPRRGEHNREVLTEWLGKDAASCQRLEASGVLESSDREPPTLDQAPRSAFREKATQPDDGDG